MTSLGYEPREAKKTPLTHAQVRPPPAPVFPLLPVEALSPVAPSGWRAPAPQVAPTLPFRVHRSHANELPVYTEFKNKKARVSTVVRRVSGDLEAFQQELQRVVGPNATIRRRVASFEVYGEGHAPIISEWLIQCGF